MSKHLFFWTGFFAAALLVVPIAAGIMGAAEQELRRAAVLIFAVVSGLVLALVLALLFRDRILRAVLGRTEATLSDVSASLIDGVSAAATGDSKAATAHAQAFVQRGIGWYTWSSFYRWVIATAVALLLAFGAFVGTVLLFEQNRKLGEQTVTLREQTVTLGRQTDALEIQTQRLTEQTDFMRSQTDLMQAQTERLREQSEAAAMQNEIMTLSLVTELRDQMLSTIESRTTIDAMRATGWQGIDSWLVAGEDADGRCSLKFSDSHIVHSSPSDATLGAIKALAARGVLGDRVIEALQLLTVDRHGGVALGALLALEKAGYPQVDGHVGLQDVIATEALVLHTQGYKLDFFGAALVNFYCPRCQIGVTGSMIYVQPGDDVSGYGNLELFRSTGGETREGVVVRPAGWVPPDDRIGTKLSIGSYFDERQEAWLITFEPEPVCSALEDLARINPVFTLERE
ncbi:MAG: hypothetical protein AAFP87_14950 [Pseudomonadota bacterium]